MHRIETSAGIVNATLRTDGAVSIENVPSWRAAAKCVVSTARHGEIVGDVAWGGNWFFLVDLETAKPTPRAIPEISRGATPELMMLAREIKEALQGASFPGVAGAAVDHIEISTSAPAADVNSRNFVLCPGNAYDRSPCGTGTSAKLACLAADGIVAEGETWIQQGVVGSTFAASYRWADREKRIIVPTITGQAHLTSETTLLFDSADPFCWGFG